MALGGRGPYVLQAAIAILHTEEAVDWPQIASLYGELARLTGSPVVELNRAAAIAEAGDPQAALELVNGLELGNYHYLYSTRAELLRRLDRTDEAREDYEPGARAGPLRRGTALPRAPARRPQRSLTAFRRPFLTAASKSLKSVSFWSA